MPEPQIPGLLVGYPTQRYPRNPNPGPGYVAGPTPNLQPMFPTGNPSVSMETPTQRMNEFKGYRAWHW